MPRMDSKGSTEFGSYCSFIPCFMTLLATQWAQIRKSMDNRILREIKFCENFPQPE